MDLGTGTGTGMAMGTVNERIGIGAGVHTPRPAQAPLPLMLGIPELRGEGEDIVIHLGAMDTVPARRKPRKGLHTRTRGRSHRPKRTMGLRKGGTWTRQRTGCER